MTDHNKFHNNYFNNSILI